MNAPVRVVAIGAGNRMRTYAHYIEQHPDEARLVAVAEPRELRRNAIGETFGVPEEQRFDDYRKLFDADIEADAAIVCTPDGEHFGACMLALGQGMHVLLEKPISPVLEECRQVEAEARRRGLLVSVCHVLRYHPLFIKLKEFVDSGDLGRIVSINHTERVGIDRATHTFVRGPWNGGGGGSPLLLAKCCHDIDLLLWLTGSECKRVSSFGSLRWFRGENAPVGSAERCIDCGMEEKCPYSAVDLYKRRREWIGNFDVAEGETLDAVVDRELREGRYGRCVFGCDNSVVDRQSVLMEMEDGAIVSLGMELFTLSSHRTMAVTLTGGEIFTDEKVVRLTDFVTRSTREIDVSHLAGLPYHAGADLRVMEEFVSAVRQGKLDTPSSISRVMAAHVVCHTAERSRQMRD